MPEENEQVIEETASSYATGEINGSFEDDSGGDLETTQTDSSPIKSSADIIKAARGEELSSAPADKNLKPDHSLKETDKELEPEDLHETVQDQIRKGKIKAPQPEEQETETQSDQATIQQTKTGRDYSGIDPKDHWQFKKMPNKEFELHKKRYIESAQLRAELAEAKKPKTGDLPTSYAEHPEAYKLSPVFNQVTQQKQFAEAIEDHWQRQAVSIQTNGKYRPLEKTERGFVPGAEVEATDEDRIFVNKQIAAAQRLVQKADSKYEQYIGDFKKNHDEAVNVIKGAEKEFFDGFDDPKHPTYPLQQQIKSKIPEALHNSPLLPLLVKTGAANALLVNENENLKKENARLKGIKKDEKEAPLNGKSFIPGGAPKGSRINSSADIRRAAMEG